MLRVVCPTALRKSSDIFPDGRKGVDGGGEFSRTSAAAIIYEPIMVTEPAAPRSVGSLRGLAVWLCAGVVLTACGRSAEAPPTGTAAGGAPSSRTDSGVSPAGTPWFTDRAAETGLDFVHFNGMSGKLLLTPR